MLANIMLFNELQHKYAKAASNFCPSMRSATIRLIVPLTLLSITGIIATQAYWIKRIYQFHERSFSQSANAGLRSAATDVMCLHGSQPPALLPVEKLGENTLGVPLGVAVEQEVIEHYLLRAFAAQNLVTDFSYAIYDCNRGTPGFTGYHQMDGGAERPHDFSFPKLKRPTYYLAVNFPHRSAPPFREMLLWTLCSVVLLGVMTFLCYLLYTIIQQRRYSEIQKDFLQNMTHEFRTPLSTIQLSAEVLKSPAIVSSPKRLYQYATIISAESAQLSAQVGRALHMYQMEKGELVYLREPLVWQNLLRDATDAFYEKVENLDGSIEMEMPDLPVQAIGDPRHLLNAIAALIDNSIKYCVDAPVISIQLMCKQNKIIIRLKDNGIGIAEAHRKRIFRKFYRVPTGSVHNVKGFGLGLSYVEETVRAHGGEVICTSNLNVGTTFSLTFPLSVSTAAVYAGNVQGQNPPRRG